MTLDLLGRKVLVHDAGTGLVRVRVIMISIVIVATIATTIVSTYVSTRVHMHACTHPHTPHTHPPKP